MPLSTTTATRVAAQWPHISYLEIRQSAEETCSNPNYDAYQGSLGTCGPVAVLRALASTSKEGFLDLVDEVYQNPKKIPENVRSDRSLLVRRGGLATLLSTYLINQENHFMTYHATTGKGDLVAGGMLPVNLKHWLRKFFPEKKIQTYNSYFYGALDNAREVNQFWEKGSSQPLVFAFVNGACLTPGLHWFTHKIPGLLAMCIGRGHFIQVTSPFCENSKGQIEFEAFSWGSIKIYRFSQPDFKKMLLKLVVAQ